jgi:hypothetical protein
MNPKEFIRIIRACPQSPMCMKNDCRLEIVARLKDGRTRTGILQEIICDCVKLTDSSHFHEYEIEDIEPCIASVAPACFKQSSRQQIMKKCKPKKP